MNFARVSGWAAIFTAVAVLALFARLIGESLSPPPIVAPEAFCEGNVLHRHVEEVVTYGSGIDLVTEKVVHDCLRGNILNPPPPVKTGNGAEKTTDI